MALRTMDDLPSVSGQRVLVRVDLNVPLLRNGVGLRDDSKLRAVVPTIRRLAQQKAKVILASHLGRPQGHDRKLSLASVAGRLSKISRRKIVFVRQDITADHGAGELLADLKPGQVALLENLRCHPGETKNDRFFARRLASLADFYVDDAFAVAHRKHASNVGVTRHLPSYAGPLLQREVHNLDRLEKHSAGAFVALLGGAKVETKLPTVKSLLRAADEVMVGGVLANVLLCAHGLSVGKSEVRRKDVVAARRLARHRKLVLPRDLVVATSVSNDTRVRVAPVDDVRSDEYILDIGPETVGDYAFRLRRASKIVWNGPLGLFEIPQFSHGTLALGRIVAARSSGRAFGVVGGGETVAALEETGMSQHVDFISTGGGAMLEYLSGQTLPGIKPLLEK